MGCCFSKNDAKFEEYSNSDKKSFNSYSEKNTQENIPNDYYFNSNNKKDYNNYSPNLKNNYNDDNSFTSNKFNNYIKVEPIVPINLFSNNNYNNNCDNNYNNNYNNNFLNNSFNSNNKIGFNNYTPKIILNNSLNDENSFNSNNRIGFNNYTPKIVLNNSLNDENSFISNKFNRYNNLTPKNSFSYNNNDDNSFNSYNKININKNNYQNEFDNLSNRSINDFNFPILKSPRLPLSNTFYNPIQNSLKLNSIIPISNFQIKNIQAFPIQNNNNLDLSFEEATNFLVEGCQISPNILDSRGNRQSGWRIGGKNGPPGYLKDYYPPIGWTGIGLKVAFLYDNGDNVWLGNDNCDGEWYIGYHGVKTIEAIQGICYDGFRRGDRQSYKDNYNINPLNNHLHLKCGEGVYFTNEINVALSYSMPIPYNGNSYRIVFMCRVNPYKVRIADIGNNKEYWIVDGDKLGDLFGYKRSDEVRPYRILVLKESQ